MVAGPYSAGGADSAQRREHLRALNQAAVALLRLGHVPVIGVNMALPMIEAAGADQSSYDEIMLPVSLALAMRCDACLRIGGASVGADAEVERFRRAGRPVYGALADVPAAHGDGSLRAAMRS